jgi:hypothetical protein
MYKLEVDTFPGYPVPFNQNLELETQNLAPEIQNLCLETS